MRTLHARLGVAMFLALAATIGLLFLIAALSIHHLMENQVATRLDHDTDSLLTGLRIMPDGSLRLHPLGIQGIYHQPGSGHYYVIDVEGQILRSTSLKGDDLPDAIGGEGGKRVVHVLGRDGEPLLMQITRVQTLGRTVQIAVAESLGDLQAGVQRIWWRLLGWAGLMVLFILLLQRYVIARSLRPIGDATDDVSRLERGEVSALREQVPREVLPLVHAINTLLARQQQRLQRSRETVGNMAHAIKTPLTLLQQLASEKVADAATRRQLEQYIDRISELVDTSLRRARIAGDSLGSSRFDLHQDLDGLVETLKRLYRDKPLAYEQRLGGYHTLPLDQQDGMELLGNLLDNAWKWARARIRLSVEGTSAAPVIHIEDDGPGVEAGARDRLTQRGARRDESTHGHGIGLSIVTSLVAAVGGELRLGRSEALGGLKVSVYFKWPDANTGTSQ